MLEFDSDFLPAWSVKSESGFQTVAFIGAKLCIAKCIKKLSTQSWFHGDKNYFCKAYEPESKALWTQWSNMSEDYL